MQRYRVYLSDQPSGVTDLEEVWCADADEAIASMLDLAGRNAAEVWRGADRIFSAPRASSFGAVMDEDAMPAAFSGFGQTLGLRTPQFPF
jgi:hypothetical protein